MSSPAPTRLRLRSSGQSRSRTGRHQWSTRHHSQRSTSQSTMGSSAICHRAAHVLLHTFATAAVRSVYPRPACFCLVHALYIRIHLLLTDLSCNIIIVFAPSSARSIVLDLSLKPAMIPRLELLSRESFIYTLAQATLRKALVVQPGTRKRRRVAGRTDGRE